MADSVKGYQIVESNMKFSYATADPAPLTGEAVRHGYCTVIGSAENH